MTEEKIIDAGKKENQPQEKSDKENLNEEQLDKIAGGFNIPELMPMDIAGSTMGK